MTRDHSNLKHRPNRNPRFTHRVFWHLNPQPAHVDDVYHVAYIDKGLWASPPWGNLRNLKIGAPMDAVCGQYGEFSVGAGYIADGRSGRSLLGENWANSTGVMCGACVFIEGKRLLVAPDDAWLHISRPVS